MLKLADLPIVFVHYPTGAGGWFLASWLWQAFDPREPVTFDKQGSGHAMQAIRNINNFYTDILESEQGMQIIHDNNYENFSYQERIKYLRENLTTTDYAPHPQIPQVISLHCCNVNLFMEAFTKAKCIQITVDEDDWLACTGNFLRKKMVTRERFDQFCTELGIGDLDQLWEKYLKLADNIKDFAWAIPYVQSTAKNQENKSEYDDRFLEISYKDYMHDDPESLVRAIINFTTFSPNDILFNDMVNNIIVYRALQLEYKL